MLRAPLATITDPSGEFEVEGGRADGDRPRSFVQAVLGPLSPLGIGIHEGPLLRLPGQREQRRDGDRQPGAGGAVLPGRSPIGARLRMPGLGEAGNWRVVVGVVGNVLHGNPLSRDRSPIAAYVPLRQSELAGAAVVVRHRGSVAAGRGALLQTLGDLDPLLVPGSVTSFDEMLSKTTLIARSVAVLFGACFAFALLLALSGTYGLMARAIGRRTREIGVRRALGATDRSILLLLLVQGGRQLGVGALIALPLTLLIGWGFSRFFPIALAVSVGTAIGVSAAITALVLAATWLPTRRAIAIPPRDALWRE